MQTSMLLGIFDWIGEFFKSLFNLIPKIMYLLYASIACVIDVLQLFFRKLAGLDVYYVDGEAITGDLVTNFITGILGINAEGLTYSALSTVFWSMLVFGIIICFVSTFIAIIKSHYTYDDKAAKGPMQYVYTGVKAIINMVAAPIIIVLALFVSEALLTALDSITSTNSGTIAALYGDAVEELHAIDTVKSATGKAKEKTFISYDLFGFQGHITYGKTSESDWSGWAIATKDAKEMALIGSKNETFSGSMFKVAAFNANRARLGQITTTGTFTGTAGSKDCRLFRNAKNQENLAEMIDTAFACNLKLKKGYVFDYGAFSGEQIVSMNYFTNFLAIGGVGFSKFNIGAVWYYYDLWQFNFIVGFAGVIVCTSIFINIILGLMTRLFMCIGLFLIAPPLFGLAPMDGGKAGKSWRESFTKQVLMTYGSVVGMNLMLMILPYMNTIDFFNIAIADYFARTLLIIVGLITIKAFIGVCSTLVGGEDANKTGDGIKKEVASVAGKATKMTIGAAKIAGKGQGMAMRAGWAGVQGTRSLIEKGMAKGNDNKRRGALQERMKHNMDPTMSAGRSTAYGRMTMGATGKKKRQEERAAVDELVRSGYTKKTAQSMVKDMRTHVDAGHTYATAAADIKRKTGSRLTTTANTARTAMVKHQTNATNASKAAGRSIKKAGSHAVGGLTGTLKLFGDGLTKNDFVKGFTEEIWPKPDHAKATAENTKATRQSAAATQAAMQGMARQEAERRYQAWLVANPTATTAQKNAEKAKIYGDYGLTP